MLATPRTCLTIAAVAGGLAVLLGAFGAHALRAMVAPDRIDIWRTAVDYHFYHALALLAVGLLSIRFPEARSLRLAAGSFIAGLIVFSGSLYLLVLTDLRWLGAVTPIGGLAFIAGWALLAVSAWREFGSPGE